MPGIDALLSSSDEDDLPSERSERIHSSSHRPSVGGIKLTPMRRMTDPELRGLRPPGLDTQDDEGSPRSPASIEMPIPGTLFEPEGVDTGGVTAASVQSSVASWTQGTSGGSRSARRRVTDGDSVGLEGTQRSALSFPSTFSGSRRYRNMPGLVRLLHFDMLDLSNVQLPSNCSLPTRLDIRTTWSNGLVSITSSTSTGNHQSRWVSPSAKPSSVGRPLSAVPEIYPDSPQDSHGATSGRMRRAPGAEGGSGGMAGYNWSHSSRTPSSTGSVASIESGELDHDEVKHSDLNRGYIMTSQRTAVDKALPASALLPAVWRCIGRIVPQLRGMMRQTRVSMALVMAMSAIGLEAGDLWEARRKLRRHLQVAAAEQRWGGPSTGGSGKRELREESAFKDLRDTVASRATVLQHHTAALGYLLVPSSSSPDGLPKEEDVLALLKEVKVARIRASAKIALGLRRPLPALSSSFALSAKPVLGLPVLSLRLSKTQTLPSAITSPEHPIAEVGFQLGDLCDQDDNADAYIPGAPSAKATAALGQLEHSVLVYSHQASHKDGAEMTILRPEVSHPAPTGPEDVQGRKLRYLASFKEMTERVRKGRHRQLAASPATTSIDKWASPAPHKPAGGVTALPVRKPKGGMKARRRAQAQIDESKWKKTSALLA